MKDFRLAVDCVIFGFDAGELRVALIRRKIPPFEGRWALPGGFVLPNETIEGAARRELFEEAGLSGGFLEQLYTFGDPGRDPRGRVVSVAHYALVPLADQKIRAATDASEAAWFAVSAVPPLAFDHAEILGTALLRLRGKVRYQPIGFELLPRKFTLPQLQHLYEAILGRELDKRNFRKKIAATGLLVALDEEEKDVGHRPGRLHRFDDRKYASLAKRGFLFEI